MDCDISETQLFSWLDRDAPELAEHLPICPRCREVAADRRIVRAALGAAGGESQIADRPHRVGPFRLGQVIGEGGQGVVYAAEQDAPRRTVAVKLIRAGIASPQTMGRFERELHLLGRLEHPGIARLYESGIADVGHGPQPYFAMEMVRGQPLTTYANEQALDIRSRLRLAANVADAVHYAHQRRVIHRDLKPGNILISSNGQTKVIDFGLARFVDQEELGNSTQTVSGQVIGTPAYMSPEQVAGALDEIDVRTDIYSLGVVMYELLSGHLPYEVRGLPILEVARRIREQEPEPLSRAIQARKHGTAVPSSARQGDSQSLQLNMRGSSRSWFGPRSLVKQLRGDVETIVAKALAKEKERRYQAASELAADIRHYLSNEPILARPASTWYRVRKFASRHKGLVGGMAATFLVLLLGILWINYERLRAEKALADVTKSRDETRQVSAFHESILGSIDAAEAGRSLTKRVLAMFEAAQQEANVPENELTAQTEAFRSQWRRVNATDLARQLIDGTILSPAVAQIDERFNEQPLVGAMLRQVLANLYWRLGLYDAAMPLQESALETRRRLLGEDDRDTLASLNSMGLLLKAQGKLNEAEPLMRQLLEQARRVFGEDDPATLSGINNVAGILAAQGKFEEAEAYFREVVERRKRTLGDEDRSTLNSMHGLGALLQRTGQFAECEKYLRETLEKQRRFLGEDDPDTIRSINSLAALLVDLGRFSEAERYCREAVDNRRRVLGEEHPETLSSLVNLARVLQAQEKYHEAESCLQGVLERQRRALGEEHPATLRTIASIGVGLLKQGKLREAEAYVREALERRKRALGEQHPETLSSLNAMAQLLTRAGRFNEAGRCLRQVLETQRRVLGEDDPDTLNTLYSIGDLLQTEGNFAEAELYYRDALSRHQQVFGKANPSTLYPQIGLAETLTELGRFVEGEALLQDAALQCDQSESCRELHWESVLADAVKLFIAWHTAEPDKGYDAKAAEWRVRLVEWQATTQPATGCSVSDRKASDGHQGTDRQPGIPGSGP